MHYDGTAFAMGNTITILDKETDEPVERNYEISPQDFELMNKIYPSDERCSRSLESSDWTVKSGKKMTKFENLL